MHEIVEIRIHGVGGGSAADLLDDHHPERIAGDDISGFYRRSREHPTLDAAKQLRRTREALAWGGNTSGSWRTALWVLLLPFALVNVGGWMHPPGQRPSPWMRVFGLTVTLAAVLLTAITVFDVLAIQCAGDVACVEGTSWLAPFGWQRDGVPVFADAPARRLAIVSVVPMVVLALLWFAGRYGYDDLEGFRGDDEKLESPDGDGLRLMDPAFWNGWEPAYRTRMVHLAAGRAMLGLVLAVSIAGVTDGVPRIIAVLLALFALVPLVYAGWVVTWRTVYARQPEDALRPKLARLRWVTYAALAAPILQGVVTRGTEPDLGAPRTFLAGLFTAPYVVLFVLAALHAVLLGALWFGRRTVLEPRAHAGGPDCDSPQVGRAAFKGRGEAVTATLALFLVVAIGAGAHRTTSAYLGAPTAIWDPVQEAGIEQVEGEAPVVEAEPECPDCEQETAIGSPWWNETTAHVLVLVLAGIAVEAVRALRRLRRAGEDDRDDDVAHHLALNPANENPIDATLPSARKRVRAVLRNWAVVCEIVEADRRLLRVVRVAGVGAVLLLLLQMPQETPGFGWRGTVIAGRSAGPLATASLWLVGLLPVAAVLLLRLAAVNERWRRQIGAMWDVLIFWPRHIHPFAPPCYSERVIPQLQWHLDHLLEEGKGVVLAGHSQGSVIASAASAVRRQKTADRFDLVVYGSPIAALYERVFPAYFGPDFYETVDTTTRRWHHLFSRTDIFAYPFWDEGWRAGPRVVCPACGHLPGRAYNDPVDVDDPIHPADPAHHVDYLVIDPELWDWPSKEPPPPPIRGHSTYATATHQEFEAHLRRIAFDQARDVHEQEAQT